MTTDDAVETRQIDSDSLTADVHRSFSFEYATEEGTHFGVVTVEYDPETWVIDGGSEAYAAMAPDGSDNRPGEWLADLYHRLVSALFPATVSRLERRGAGDIPLAVTYDYHTEDGFKGELTLGSML